MSSIYDIHSLSVVCRCSCCADEYVTPHEECPRIAGFRESRRHPDVVDVDFTQLAYPHREKNLTIFQGWQHTEASTYMDHAGYKYLLSFDGRYS